MVKYYLKPANYDTIVMNMQKKKTQKKLQNYKFRTQIEAKGQRMNELNIHKPSSMIQ